MKIFWTIISVILIYQCIIFTGVFMPFIYNNFFQKPIETFRFMVQQTFEGEGLQHNFIPPRSDQKGVIIYNEDKAFDGYTFLISADKNEARLIDMYGEIVHSWAKDSSELWGKDIPEAQKLFYFWLRGSINPETGDLLVNPLSQDIYNQTLASLTKMDKNSNIIWQKQLGANHDVEYGPDGNIYGLGGTTLMDSDPDLPNIAPPMNDEYLFILSPDGEVLKKLSFRELFKNSDARIALQRVSHVPQDPDLPKGDIFHSNSFSFVPEAAIGKAPMLKEGHILVSFRNLDLLVMIDPKAEKITWASYGPYKGQHSPKILEDGSVLLFDNLGNLKSGGHSRILRLNLNDMRIVWEYAGTPDHPLASWHSSRVQRLPNDNLLITETEGGRIFEITPDKEIVWEYWMPIRYTLKQGDGGKIPAVYSGRRFAKDEIKFLDNNLTEDAAP